MTTESLQKTPLYDLHVRLGGKMVPFAGYEMPVNYPAGIMSEHRHTRSAAGLFDVSHMGQARVSGKEAEAALETVISADLSTLKTGRIRYSLLMNDNGGIVDDLMIARRDGYFHLVLNAARKAVDLPLLAEALASVDARLSVSEDAALLALQGPKAGAVLESFSPEVADLAFMEVADVSLAGVDIQVARCGYTGEDGFELSIPASSAQAIAERLLTHDDVMPIGLGARDSLRLEAGLCLYGHDIDETTTPVEADLTFAIGKRRKMQRDFPGAERVMNQLDNGFDRVRIGLMIEGRRPAREGAPILSPEGAVIGQVTSGGFSPTLEQPIAMGYVQREFSLDGFALAVDVRGSHLPAQVAPLPFVPQRYRRRSTQTAA